MAHRSLLNVMSQPGWVGRGGGLRENGTLISMVQSLRCSPETATILLIGYAPIQNVMVLKNK